MKFNIRLQIEAVKALITPYYNILWIMENIISTINI